MAVRWRIITRPRLTTASSVVLVTRGAGACGRTTRATLGRQRRTDRFAPVDVAAKRRWLAGHAPRELARLLLSPLGDRWAHTQAAAAQAERGAVTVPARDRGLVIAAAWLHDIGYAAPLHDTGFHPLDGARYMRRIGAPMRLAALVAHHSEADLLAEARGLLDQLEEFPREQLLVTDVLAYADMTAGPAGQVMSVPDRLADIRARHAHETPRLNAARLSREPLPAAAAARVQRRLRDAG